jgi:CHAT domain-containing protein
MPPARAWTGLLRRLLLPFLLAAFFSGAAEAKRIGPDLEVYDPPFTRSDPAVAAILKAYDSERDDEVERLSRSLLDAREAKGAAPLARVEILFLLGRAEQDLKRPSEAESHYRAALALLKPLVGGKSGGAKKARQWAYYLEYHLREALEGQGRRREAGLLQSILPPPPPAPPGQESERAGVGDLPGIRVTACPGAPAPARVLSQAEQDRRDALESAALGAFHRQRYGEAEKALRDKLAFDLAAFGAPHCEVAVDRAMLADALFSKDMGANAEAEGLARQALTVFDSLPQPPPARLGTIHLLAEIVAARWGPRQAEPFLRRIYDGWETREDSRQKLEARADLAGNLYAQGRTGEAEALYRKALATAAAIHEENGDLALDIHVFLGFLAGGRGDDSAAIAEYRLACTVRGEYAAQASRGSRATLLASDETKQAGSCALRRALALRRWAEAGGGPAAGDRPDALRAEAFEAAQGALPSPSADALARSSARIAAARSGQGALAERFEEALRRRDAAGGPRRPSWDASETPSSLSQEERDRLDAEIADLATRLAAADPRFWDLRAPRPLGLAALRRLLRPDEALVFFLVPPKHLFGLVFAVSRDAAGWAPLGMDGDALREKVAALRGGIDAHAYGVTPGGKPDDGYLQPYDRRLAYALYRALLGDAEIQKVVKPARVLIVVPTGPLTSLPPGLLVTAPPAGGDEDPAALRGTAWLLRDKAVALLPSVASLGTLRRPAAAALERPVEPLLAFADPDFPGAAAGAGRGEEARRGYDAYYRGGEPDLAALKRLPRLAHTRQEALALAAALDAPATDVLTGRDASRGELMARSADGRLARARVIEFATHGLVGGAGDGLAEPALVLAAGATPRDWLLTASDAATLRIDADWVLLSACNTASPDGGGAEGLSGLVRGFFHAGASALLVSHWSVQDEAASRLIPRTLLLQRDGRVGRAEALRRASLELLDAPGGDFAHPFFWAPFTLVGDPF